MDAPGCFGLLRSGGARRGLHARRWVISVVVVIVVCYVLFVLVLLFFLFSMGRRMGMGLVGAVGWRRLLRLRGIGVVVLRVLGCGPLDDRL